MDIPTNTSLLNDQKYLNTLNQNNTGNNTKSESTEIMDEMNHSANADLLDKMNEDTFLNLNLKTVFEEFLLTWHKIIFDLINPELYIIKTEGEWWKSLFEATKKILNVFLESKRLFYVGIGLIIISFFVYFILVTG